MKSEGKHLLLSMDFRPGKGGIARVARLMYDSIPFHQVFSLHGSNSSEVGIKYFHLRKWFFTLNFFCYIFFTRPTLIVFDHLYLARLLVFVPKFFLKKVVVFLHDEEAWVELNALHTKALVKATHILCNSEFTKKKFIDKNPGFDSKTTVCLLGGVPERFLKKSYGTSENYADWLNDPRPYCLFVSRLWKAHSYKGYWELLRAFKGHYQSGNVGLRLAIIGNGDDAEEVSSFIQHEKLSDSISLFQNVSDEDLVHFYKRSLSLFFPSTREGFGMVYLEAMFFRKACIGVAGQPAEEIIINGKTGVLLENNGESELRRIIEDMEIHPSKYQEYGNAGYERYLSYFSNIHFKERFLKAIN
jgi:glycosyltransferase involved in cell wall biosynthesis